MKHSGSLNYLSFSQYQILSQEKNSLSLSPHWFLIRILTSIINLTTYGNSMNVSFSSYNMVTNGWFKMYLNQLQQQFLINSGKFELYPIENLHKISHLSSFENQNCYVYASTDWAPPSGAHIVQHITNTLFFVKNLTINDSVKNDPRILLIKPASHKKLNNRYNSGFLQTHHQNSIYDQNFYGPIRSLHHLGLDGRGEVINIVDTGIDAYNAMFFDLNHSVESISGKTNDNHRKIVRIEPYADYFDSSGGHGTHVAGIAAGRAFCEEDLCGISQYNGIAPGAKIYFSDIGYADVEGDMSEDIDLEEQTKLLREQNSFVSSNSWGYSFSMSEEAFKYDVIAYKNPDILYLFAAGNNFVFLSIDSPGIAKNVVCVGATRSVSSSDAEFLTFSVVIENETVSVECEEVSDQMIRKLGISEKMTYIVNRSIVSYDGFHSNLSVENSIVILDVDNSTNSSDLCDMYSTVISYGASAVIYRSSVNLSCSSFSVPTIVVSSYDDFNKISEMKRASIFPYPGKDDADLPMVAPLSSKGPCDTGLSKPDIALPGVDVTSAKSHGTSTDYKVTSDFSSNLFQQSGTSMATPAASALAIIVRQFFIEGFYPNLKKNPADSITPSSSLMRAILVNSAVKPNRRAEYSGPDFDVGFGIPCLEAVLGFRDSGLRVVDNVEMKSQSHHVYRVNLDNNSCDLRVTVHYLDPPVDPENEAIFFADLDLFVKSPANTWYVGNGVENLSDSDSFSNTERVIVDKDEIPSNGGEFEVHVISSNYPIDSQKVTYSIVVNGPFEQTVSPKNQLFLKFKEATEIDCAKDCSGNGKCSNKGLCECNDESIGVSCSTKITTVEAGETYTDSLVHKQIKYFKVSPNDHSSSLASVNFSIDTETDAASIFLCTSTDPNPGKITNQAWQCFRWMMESYSFELSEEEDFESFFIAVYVNFFNPVDVKLTDIAFTLREKLPAATATPSPTKNNKKVLFIVGMVICGVVLIGLLTGLIILIVRIVQKKKKSTIPDDLNETIIPSDDPHNNIASI